MLKDAVGAIQRTVEVEVDYKIIAADGVRGTGAALDKFSFLGCDKKVSLPKLHRISRNPSFFEKILTVRDDLCGNLSDVLEYSLCERKVKALFIDIDLAGKKICLAHENHLSLKI